MYTLSRYISTPMLGALLQKNRCMCPGPSMGCTLPALSFRLTILSTAPPTSVMINGTSLLPPHPCKYGVEPMSARLLPNRYRTSTFVPTWFVFAVRFLRSSHRFRFPIQSGWLYTVLDVGRIPWTADRANDERLSGWEQHFFSVSSSPFHSHGCRSLLLVRSTCSHSFVRSRFLSLRLFFPICCSTNP